MSKWEILKILSSVILGATIAYFSSWYFQNGLFRKQEKDKKEILRSQLLALAQSIEDDFKRLNDLKSIINGNGYPREYFESNIKESIIIYITKTYIFPTNKDIFDRAIRMIRKLSLLNKQIEVIQDVISGKDTRIMQKNSKLRIEVDQATTIISDIINGDIKENNNLPELSENMKRIAAGI